MALCRSAREVDRERCYARFLTGYSMGGSVRSEVYLEKDGVQRAPKTSDWSRIPYDSLSAWVGWLFDLERARESPPMEGRSCVFS
jgi:hypothetical protein